MADIDNKEQPELDQDLDDVEEVEVEETQIKAYKFTVQMMQNPQILAALQERLDGLVDTPTRYIESLPRERDEPILKPLKDIKVKFSDAGQPMSFILEFHFEPNEYFTNEVLTKTYRMRSEPDDSDPFSFDGPEIMGCTGCQIDWKKGKNVTLKTIKKKQKHKRCGTVCTVAKTISNDYFFNFFPPPEVPESGDLDDNAEAILAADFEIGHFLCEHVIPRSVLYFTGEAIEDDDDDYDKEGEEADEEGEEEDEE
ncbi:Nucleosome assembly protein 1-like 1 [Heterocephalus glaber]|uniref:Nucleosome assembly protein 1-like 1 n=1 Tax=Heterocephalus glaber TaxID=10181 RepID=G5BJ42_HETGA|nr:Nucleosome assembly protein 1-like 1 [Heterocephalus glaber]